MKSLILLTSALLAIQVISFGQSDSIKIKLYDSWYDLYSEDKRQGNLYTYEFGDSTVTVIAQKKYLTGIMPTAADLHILPVKDISNILLRKKGRKTIGLVSGFLSGAIIGALIGHSKGGTSVEDTYYGQEMFYVSAGFKTFIGAVIGGGIGVAIGLPIGASKKNFKINGNAAKYHEIKPDLLKYSIRYYTP